MKTERKRTKLQGFKKHIVSNFLKDRHPYLEPPFKDRINPNEVFHAVFDRSIPKLDEILSTPDLKDQDYREAFMLLNEMVSHQENKDKMISRDLILTCLNYMRHKDFEVRREAIILLGSLLTVMRGRNCLLERKILQNHELYLVDPLSNILVTDGLGCREACGWMLCRLTSGRDGIDIVVKRFNEVIKFLIASFMKYTKELDKQEARFIIYLLETFSNLLQFDDGIENFIGTGIMNRLNEVLLREDTPYGEYDRRIRYLALATIGLMTVNPEGKEEAITLNVIDTANRYLKNEDDNIVKNAVLVIMFTSIHLRGKAQCTHYKDDSLIKNLIKMLSSENDDIYTNVRQVLVIIADLPKGFKIIVKYLSVHINHLEEIFGPSAIMPLFALLFKIDNPPFLTKENLEDAKRYAIGISHFINRDEHETEALQYSIEKACRITERLLPVMLDPTNALDQERISRAIIKVCEQDEVNRYALMLMINKHGDFESPMFKTTLKAEANKFKGLMELYKQAVTESSTKEELP